MDLIRVGDYEIKTGKTSAPSTQCTNHHICNRHKDKKKYIVGVFNKYLLYIQSLQIVGIQWRVKGHSFEPLELWESKSTVGKNPIIY